MKLFDTGKTGFFLDSITHKTEKRRDGETKVIALGFRVVPFDHKLAASIDQSVRASLFTLNDPSRAQNHVAALDFTLPFERQDVTIYASPDTEAGSLLLQQVKVSNLRAQLEKGSNAFVLKGKLTFGPASQQELAFVESWRGTQRFLTFEESQPDLAYEEVGSSDEDEDDDSQPALDMEDDDGEEEEESVGATASKPERAQHKPISHAKRNGKKKR